MSDSEGEDRPSFAVPKYKENYIELEAQLNAYIMYKGSQIAFKPNKSADYILQGEIILSENDAIRPSAPVCRRGRIWFGIELHHGSREADEMENWVLSGGSEIR